MSEVAQSCPTLCDPMDCSPPGSSIHGIFQARILKWVVISFSRRSSGPRDWTPVSHIVSQFSLSVVSNSATPWIAAHQASLSITNSRSLLKLMPIVCDAIQPSHPLSSPSWMLYHLSHQGSLTMEYYSAIKESKVRPFTETWMDLEIIMLSEVNPTEKDKYYMISLIFGL